VKVLIADDHKLVLDGLKLYLHRKRPDVDVVCAETFEEASIQAAETRDLDAAVLDLFMPGMNGLRGLRTMRSRHPDLPVLIMSGLADGAMIREALSSGAAGFIPKDLPGQSMISALDLALAGETYVPPAAFSDLSLPERLPRSAESTSAPSNENPLHSLSKRERQVLVHLVEGMSSKEIALAIGTSTPTVSFHLTKIFRKLDVSQRTEAVSKAVSLGLGA